MPDPPTAKELVAATSRFKWWTGVGTDGFVPRAVSQLERVVGQPGLEALGTIIATAERNGHWPARTLVNLMIQRPKPDGEGYRLVTLLHFLARFWGAVRAPEIREWEKRHTSDEFWAGPGRSSAAAAWYHNLHAEIAVEQGGCSATALADLRKAFEMVSWSHVVEEAVATGFPLHVLQLAFRAYASPRLAVGAQGSLSKAVEVKQGVMAGCTFAMSCLKCLLYRMIKRVSGVCMGMMLRVFVDDLTVQWVGKLARDALKLVRATRLLREGLADLRLPTSPEKSALVCSSAAVARVLARPMRARVFPVLRTARNLGYDCHGKGAAPVQGKRRLDKARARLQRFGKLARAVKKRIAKVVNAGLKPAFGV